MTIGVILPHSRLYGGVKRFFELGNLFINDGHTFVVFNEKGDKPSWFDFRGEIVTVEEIGSYSLDVLFFTEPRYYQTVAGAKVGRRIFYFVKAKENLKQIVNDSRFEIFVNSSNLYHECRKRYGIEPFRALGGIDTKMYCPGDYIPRSQSDEFVVLTFGRLSKKRKGTRFIVKACERVYRRNRNIRLILFDTPTDDKAREAIDNFSCNVPHEFVLNHPYEKNPELFHRAHIYVSAEYKTGYSNTSAEAMACGIPVVGTVSGTKDFLINNVTGIVVARNRFSIARGIRRMMDDEALRHRLSTEGRKKIEEYSWANLYATIIDYLKQPVNLSAGEKQ